MEKSKYLVEFSKESLDILIEKLSKESDELYMKQVVYVGEEKNKVLERFMIVQDLLSQFELIKLKIDANETK